MIFALLTLLTALALAGVSGWFSIIGVMAIYAGAPMHALIMGIVLEAGKLVTTSWLYRNWNYSGWTLKGPLIVFTLILMLATSIGVFGFLSKSHLEQGAKTIDNAPKIERIEQQIAREKATITDNEKVISQLDTTISSYLGKDRADRSVVIRRIQAPQRKQLRDDIDAANKRIDGFSEEKFKLQSELRELELEVGPIRYIAELIYGAENNSTKNIEGAVKIFTLLIVSTLDPLAVILLVAANHTLLRRQNEEKAQKDKIGQVKSHDEVAGNQEIDTEHVSISEDYIRETVPISHPSSQEASIHGSLSEAPLEAINEETTTNSNKDAEGDGPQNDPSLGYHETPTEIIREILVEDTQASTDRKTERPELQDTVLNEEEIAALEEFKSAKRGPPLPIIRSPGYTRVLSEEVPASTNVEPAVEEKISEKQVRWEEQNSVVRELVGTHFVPLRINEEEKLTQVETSSTEKASAEPISSTQEIQEVSEETQNSHGKIAGTRNSIRSEIDHTRHKYPKALSWLTEFNRK